MCSWLLLQVVSGQVHMMMDRRHNLGVRLGGGEGVEQDGQNGDGVGRRANFTRCCMPKPNPLHRSNLPAPLYTDLPHLYCCCRSYRLRVQVWAYLAINVPLYQGSLLGLELHHGIQQTAWCCYIAIWANRWD